MFKRSQILPLSLLLVLSLLLAGCGQGGGSSQSVAPQTASTNADTQNPGTTDGDAEAADAQSRDTAASASPVLNETLRSILETYTTREFVAGEVAAADLELILQAGSMATSARNGQPWHFIAVTNPELVAAQNFPEGMALIVVCGESAQQEGVVVDFDCALATQNMFLAARSLGLGAHIYTGPVRQLNSEESRAALTMPQGYDAVALLAVGCESETVDVTSAASERKDLDAIVTYVS